MFLYESHLGGFYADEDKREFRDLYCNECGDFDRYIGEAKSRKEARELLKNYCDDIETYANKLGEIRNFLNRYFEPGIYKHIRAYKYLDVIQEDNEYIVTSTDEFDGTKIHYICKDKQEDAIDYAERTERQINGMARQITGYLSLLNIVPEWIADCGADELAGILDFVMQEIEQIILIDLYKRKEKEK